MKVGFLTFDKDRRDKTGSARIRCHNLIKYAPDFEEFIAGVKYDAVVFQKFYWAEYAEKFPGIKVLDICDPDWLGGSKDLELRRILNAIDGVVANTENMAQYMRKLTDKPVVVIPDRHDMALFKEKKIHTGRAKSVVWFGYSHNAHILEMYIGKLEELGLELTIISEKPVSVCRTNRQFKPYEHFVKWPSSVSEVNRELLKHDFALLPVRRRPQDQYKSNNKTTHAWAVGLPVANWGDEIETFMEAEARNKDVDEHFALARTEYDCKISVSEMENFLAELKAKKVS